jgi:pimeloyl-ACP methyl ester carboxylesterase
MPVFFDSIIVLLEFPVTFVSYSLNKHINFLNERIPDSELIINPQSGHMTFVDQPDMFIKSIEDFLK